MSGSIILTAREVRGVLDGSITQIRRIVKPQPVAVDWCTNGYWIGLHELGDDAWDELRCPFGKPGDRIIGKEAWGISQGRGIAAPPRFPKGTVLYKADHGITSGGIEYDLQRWKSAACMPSEHSRLTLINAGVRVERAQAVKWPDAVAFGCDEQFNETVEPCSGKQYCEGLHTGPIWHFQRLWDQEHGKGAWTRNDWVFVLDFTKEQR